MKRVGVSLEHRLGTARPHDLFDVNIFLKGEPAQEALTDDGEGGAAVAAAPATLEAIKHRCAVEQAPLVSLLSSRAGEADFTDGDAGVPRARAVRQLWVTNSVGAEVSLSTLKEVLDRPDVLLVELNRRAPIEELIDAAADRMRGRGGRARGATVKAALEKARKRPGKAAASGLVDGLVDGATWSVKQVNAHLLWQKGITGEGVVVAVVDTGVNYKHPDLKGRM